MLLPPSRPLLPSTKHTNSTTLHPPRPILGPPLLTETSDGTICYYHESAETSNLHQEGSPSAYLSEARNVSPPSSSLLQHDLIDILRSQSLKDLYGGGILREEECRCGGCGSFVEDSGVGRSVFTSQELDRSDFTSFGY